VWRFAFELCRVLACPHPARLHTPPWNLTADQFDDWLAVWEADPWSQQRQDLRSAAMVANLLGPHINDSAWEPPSLLFPYFDTDDTSDLDPDLDPSGQLLSLTAYRERYGYGA